MSHIDIFSYYKSMKNDNVFLSFNGLLSQNILVELGQSLKDKLSENNIDEKNSMRIFAIFIELSQNINKYSAERVSMGANSSNYGYGTILFKDSGDSITIQSGNLLENLRQKRIESKCEHISKLSYDELKAYYKRQRKMPPEEESKGAGLGIIDIALKTTNQLDTKFYPVNDTHSYFVFTVTINLEKEKTMKDLFIAASKATPEINFSAETGILEFKGSSYPENPAEFYGEAVQWLENYIEDQKTIVMNFKLDYYNTSSSKQILDIIDILEEYYEEGGKVEANWYYEGNDDDMREVGEDFFKDIEMKTSVIAY